MKNLRSRDSETFAFGQRQDRMFFDLILDQIPVIFFTGQQFVMRTDFNNFPLRENNNPIRIRGGGDPM